MREAAKNTMGRAFMEAAWVGRATTFCVGLVAMPTVLLAVLLVGFSVMLAVVFAMFALPLRGLPRTRPPDGPADSRRPRLLYPRPRF